jgi:hypothetical protein
LKEGVLLIETGELIDGEFPIKQKKLVAAWIEIHRGVESRKEKRDGT